jgi:adenine deaminase
MRKTFALLWILLLPGLLLGQTMTTSPSRPLVLTHVTVIDITRGRAKSEMTLILEGEHIVALDTGGKVKVPQDAQVIDATGKYLIPGLWDMHVHEWNKEVFFPLFIANGITGVRDMFSPLPPIKQWRAEIAAGTTTINPAKYFDMEKSLGTVEKGKLADLVLLDANPLEDISNTKKINAVVLNGRLLDRKTLDKMLADVEAAANKK